MKPALSPIRIVLADDHEIFRDGFNSLLKKQEEIRLIGEAADGNELVRITGELLPDVVLTDIRMPGMDGIDATRIISEKYPQVNVIALSMFNDDNLVLDMMEAGAKGYLLKNAHKSEIIDAIKTVFNQEVYYCKQTSVKLIRLLAGSSHITHKDKLGLSFTEKEVEVIRLICQQNSNKEMAEILHFSIRTVEGYRKKIQEKMKVRNSAGIVVYAIKNNIYKL